MKVVGQVTSPYKSRSDCASGFMDINESDRGKSVLDINEVIGLSGSGL